MPSSEQSTGRAEMPVAAEFLHQLIGLPDDVHIVGVRWDDVTQAGSGNILFTLQAFSDSEFPSETVYAVFKDDENSMRVIQAKFVKWEPIDDTYGFVGD